MAELELEVFKWLAEHELCSGMAWHVASGAASVLQMFVCRSDTREYCACTLKKCAAGFVGECGSVLVDMVVSNVWCSVYLARGSTSKYHNPLPEPVCL